MGVTGISVAATWKCRNHETTVAMYVSPVQWERCAGGATGI